MDCVGKRSAFRGRCISLWADEELSSNDSTVCPWTYAWSRAYPYNPWHITIPDIPNLPNISDIPSITDIPDIPVITDILDISDIVTSHQMPQKEEFEIKTYIFHQKTLEYVGFLSFPRMVSNTKAMCANLEDDHNNEAPAKTLVFQGV